MLHLTDYFSVLNLWNLSIYFIFILCCEVIGFTISKLVIKEIPSYLRGSLWFLGLGLIVFLYFLVHFFLPFSYPTLLYVLPILVIPSIYVYIKNKGWISLIDFLKHNYLPFVFVLLILPKVMILSSLPPYRWDEMAYHYISPYTLNFEKVWNIGNGFYSNLPRLLETAFIGLFSLTKTYSVARFLQFSIFITSLLTAYSFLKKNCGYFVGIAFFLLALFHPADLLSQSTWGYIDVGTISFVLIAFITFLGYVFSHNINELIYSLAFWGLAVGTKYSALTQLLSISLILLISFFINKISLKSYFKNLLIGLLLFIILGGYWYIKNLIHTGNPVYPFIFGCRLNSCNSVSLSYTIPFTLVNFSKIWLIIFPNIFYQVIFLLSIPLIFFGKLKKLKKILVVVLLFFAFELLLIKNISGFEDRYFYHWQLLSVFVISLALSNFKENKIYKLLSSFINRDKKHAYKKLSK